MNRATGSVRHRLAAASFAAAMLAGAASAHPHPDGGGRTAEKIIMVDGRSDAAGAGKRIRQFHFRDAEAAAARCLEEQTGVDGGAVDGEGAAERTRILICGDDGLSATERADKLEQTLARLRERDHLGAEHRAKVEAALSAAISRLRKAE